MGKQVVHFEGDLDIRKRSKGLWTERVTLVRTQGLGLAVCFAPPDSPVTDRPTKVTCKRCIKMIEDADLTALQAPVSPGFRAQLDGPTDTPSGEPK